MGKSIMLIEQAARNSTARRSKDLIGQATRDGIQGRTTIHVELQL